MIKFSKSGNINGKFKSLAIADGNNFIDFETGEVINLASIIYQVIGDEPFDMTLVQKSETDITPSNE